MTLPDRDGLTLDRLLLSAREMLRALRADDWEDIYEARRQMCRLVGLLDAGVEAHDWSEWVEWVDGPDVLRYRHCVRCGQSVSEKVRR